MGAGSTALEHDVTAVLRIKLPREATGIAYADDIAIAVIDKHLEDVVWACETSVMPFTKYLGVMLNHRMTFKEELSYASEKIG